MKKVLSVVLLTILMTAMAFAAGGQEESAGSSADMGNMDYALEQVGPITGSPLSDIRVRQAIGYAIDMDAVCASLFEGKAVPADSLIENGPWKATGLDRYKYDPEKAKALLAAAGWDSDYVLDVVYYYGDQLTVDLMTVMQAYLGEVGMQMTFRRVTGDVASQLWVSPANQEIGPAEVDWDIAYGAIGSAVLGGFFGRFTSTAANNSHTPTDVKYDALVDATRSTADVAKQMAAYNALSKYENKALYGLPLYYQQVFVAESKRVDRKGIPYGNEQFAYNWRIIDWDVTPDKNGERTLYMNSGPTEFFQHTFVNPGLMSTNKLIFDRLITADGSLTPSQGQLAEDYSLSADGLTLTMDLRNGVKWHDGVDFTAEDVQFTIEYTLKVPGINPIVEKTYASIEGAEAYKSGSADSVSGIQIDGDRITIKFAKLDPDAVFSFSQWPPLPKHLLEGTDPVTAQQNSYWQKPLGTGPFMVDEVNMNDYCTLVPFDKYWDKTGTGNIEKVFLTPSMDSDPNLVVNAEAGMIDYAFTKVVADVQAIESMDNMKIIPVDIRYTRLLYFNKFDRK
ncbi:MULTISPECIES: ABC transporter substrate-binding protein [unclassified Oceanispirochaeta]|uniref:ABC transporter substrate-binding protein n=1 Tax=unclassified Oceanispirochaeta TaxID=2635722 RepID=UPI000E09498D|nr:MULTISPECIES: ABC transporter substrate-binding protein [unclassified Oceanispirochaeta]MBF9014283.1 peptide ABC transporter substrate-binding protein [Oceanispirochaeta sp. M2]NPD71169.1 peptide ABC transporter substrate-binding protein [Oceanispirochaeta sp. M1]RDG33561.1 peptide ABC transporter substrate-binding protein [Oceanispirochaeta sp. M1]